MRYKLVHVYSTGDTHMSDWDKLLNLLENGWTIISVVADKYKLNYILEEKG